MKALTRKLARRYGMVLKKYIANPEEAILVQANGLGRAAMAGGLGVLDMALIHQTSIAGLLDCTEFRERRRKFMRASAVFLLEALTPFEMACRGFREANKQLQQLIKDAEDANVTLHREIDKRKTAEKVLRARESRMQELLAESRELQENLRRYSNKILYVQETERRRISRELHDDVGQALTAAGIAFENILTSYPNPQKASLEDARALLQDAMVKVHDFARDLRPTILDELGLLPALRSYLDRVAARTGLQITFRATRHAEALGEDEKITLFRVAQESLTNVAKHARAHRVQVIIFGGRGGIRMEVRDDGRSFHPQNFDRAAKKHRLGLLGMQERVRLVNGSFTLLARPGKGTQISVALPCKGPAVGRGGAKAIGGSQT